MQKENEIEIEEVSNDDVLDQVKDLKENSVSKEKYERLQSDYNKLMSAYIEGEKLEADEKEEKVSVEEKRKFLSQDDITNLDFIKGSLELRKAVLEETGEDIFVGRGHKLVVTEEDRQAAQRVADGLQELVDKADGDPEVFLSDYQRIVKDTPLPKKRR